jgi:HK97 family phage major capsid protein
MTNPVITRLGNVAEQNRDLVPAETANLNTARERITAIDEQLTPLRAFEELRSTHRATGEQFRGTGSGEGRQLAQVTETAHEYRSAGALIVDMIRATQEQDHGATRRLQSTGLEIRGEQIYRPAPDETRAAAPHTTTAETPGLLPTPIVGAIMSDIDAARPFISSVGAKDLGGIPGTSFKRPTITQHVTVDVQAGEKVEVEDGQFKVGSVSFSKNTYGGWTNVSRQDIDWTSPAVWDALLSDFQEQYGLVTENAAADAFVTAVTQTQEIVGLSALGDNVTIDNLLTALYAAASKAYQGSGRLPDTIWASLDWWAAMGPMIDKLKANTAGNGGGDSSVDSFAGNLLNVRRIVVPSMAAGTLIVGVSSRTEVYEDRFGFLSAIQPRVFGVELAYGGYMASGTIKPAAFCKLVNATDS